MKKSLKYITLFCLMLTSLACKKGFLEESSQDLVRPTTTAALNQLMTGEAYPLTVAIHDYIELLSDDVQSDYSNVAVVTTALNKYIAPYRWQKDMVDRLAEENVANSNLWYNYYMRIKGCNVVLDYVDNVVGSEAEKQNLRGQALALRSYYYFMLVNFFGQPYSGPSTVNPSTDLGVPLILTAEVTDEPIKRATVKEVYDRIEEDLLTSIPLLDANGAGNHIYKFNGTAARFILAKIYLYQGNWNESLKYTEEVLQRKASLKQYNEIPTATTVYAVSSGVSSPEVIWGYGFQAELANMPYGSNSSSRAAFSVSDNLINTYDPADLRLKYNYVSIAYFGANSLISYKGRSAKFLITGNSKAFRTAEAYLNRAEVNIQKALAGDASAVIKALADINLVRSNRITTANYTPINITNPQDLFTYYKAERRRELSFEDNRWFDLRRWGMPSIQHTYQLSDGSPQTETLQQNDPRYVLGIPTEALNRNASLIQNP